MFKTESSRISVRLADARVQGLPLYASQITITQLAQANLIKTD